MNYRNALQEYVSNALHEDVVKVLQFQVDSQYNNTNVFVAQVTYCGDNCKHFSVSDLGTKKNLATNSACEEALKQLKQKCAVVEQKKPEPPITNSDEVNHCILSEFIEKQNIQYQIFYDTSVHYNHHVSNTVETLKLSSQFIVIDIEQVRDCYIIQLCSIFGKDEKFVYLFVQYNSTIIPDPILSLLKNANMTKIWCRNDFEKFPRVEQSNVLDLQPLVKFLYISSCENNSNSSRSWQTVPSLVNMCKTIGNVFSSEDLEVLEKIKLDFKKSFETKTYWNGDLLNLYAVVDVFVIASCAKKLYLLYNQ